MTEQPKIYLTDDQLAWFQFKERERNQIIQDTADKQRAAFEKIVKWVEVQGATPVMSRRDYFAGMAMQGMMAHQVAIASPPSMAGWACQMADAIIAALDGSEK